MALNLVNSDDIELVENEDKLKANFSATRTQELEEINEQLEDMTDLDNSILSALGLSQNNWSSTETYSIGDIVIDKHSLYENITGTNTTTRPNEDTTNWELVPIIVDE